MSEVGSALKLVGDAIRRSAEALWSGVKAVARGTAAAAVALWPWLLGAIALAGPYVLLETVAPSAIGAWSAAYVAGAAGGLVLELIRSKWLVELPSRVPDSTAGVADFNQPTGPRVDIGVFGRLTTSALAAPTFLIIINALDNTEPAGGMAAFLTGIATRPDTLAWAVLLGAVSPVVWQLGESFVKARFAVADTRLEAMNASAKAALEKLKDEQTKSRRKAKEATKKRGGQRRGARVDEGMKVMLAGAGTPAEISEVLAGNGGVIELVDEGDDDTLDALVEYDAAISEAIGALRAATAAAAATESGES